MNWIGDLQKSIDVIERHLLEECSVKDIAESISLSPFYYQKAFHVFTGYTVSEYIRNRRLYLAAIDLKNTDLPVVEIALKYGYSTQQAFDKAFRRFHGFSPKQAKDKTKQPRLFLPLFIQVKTTGGYEMDYIIEDTPSLTLIGLSKRIKEGKGYEECPKFWDEFQTKLGKEKDDSIWKRIVKENVVGEFALCQDDSKDGSFLYMIAGVYQGGEVNEGFELIKLPATKYIKFKCVGPLPGSLQALNHKIWGEFVPSLSEYRLAANFNLEWYSNGNPDDDDYESGIWLPLIENMVAASAEQKNKSTDSYCGADCSNCPFHPHCGGCLETCGSPFGGSCPLASAIKNNPSQDNARTIENLKQEYKDILNGLKIPDMPKVTELYALNGSYINMEFLLPKGRKVKLLNDKDTYLGCQLEIPGTNRCFGIGMDEHVIMICTYGEAGADPKIIYFKQR